MTRISKKHGKSALAGHNIRGTTGTSIGAPVRSKSMRGVRMPPFHILSKKDIEKELSRIEKRFGMSPEEFHKAWKEGKVHGHEAMKLGCYYEFYKDEYV